MRVKKKIRSNNGSESDQNLYQKNKKKKSCNFYKMEVPTGGKAHMNFFFQKKNYGKSS